MALKFYWANDLTGGGVGALDKIPTANWLDKYGALVVKSNYFYAYECDDDLGGAESSPWLITPDDEGGNKRLNLLGAIFEDVKTKLAKLYDTNQSNLLSLKWNEASAADYTLNLAVGGASRTLTLNENFTIGDGTNITITGVTAARTFTMNENLTIGDGYNGTLTFSADAKTLTVENTAVVSQDYTSDASPTFANLSLGTGELTAGSVNKAADSLTLEIAGTAVLTIAAASVTLAQDLKTDRWESSDTNTYLGVGVAGAGNASGALRNTFLGYQAGNALTSGDDNLCVGYQAGVALTEGVQNTLLGPYAGDALTTTSYNFALGHQALTSESSGEKNVAIGKSALASQDSGSLNVGIGYYAGLYNVLGDYNTIIGSEAAQGASGQSYEKTVIIGRRAGFAITTGSRNILIGYQAGNVITSGTQNIIIGYDIDPSAANATNEINIGGVYKGDTSTTVPSFGTYAALDGESVAGYITIKDLAGNDRKIAVVV